MKMLKSYIRTLYSFGILLINVFYDTLRYFNYSASNSKPLTNNQLKARLFQKAHSIEKGLSLPSVRSGFGTEALSELNYLIKLFDERNLDKTDISFLSAKHAISAYIFHHQVEHKDIPEELNFIHSLCVDNFSSDLGGTLLLNREIIINNMKKDFFSLVHARHSTRMFSSIPPDIELINKSIHLAKLSPSVCNRQGGRISIITNTELLRDVLHLQGGNRGFTDEIPMILVVTCYVGLFRGARERNQCWIDGGLFSMTLLYALSFYGFGTCPLNWSSDYKQDIKLRKVLQIPDDQMIVMLIAVGNLRDEYRVASSARNNDDQITLRIYS